jgi:ribosomal protein L11 methyltransferase
MTGKTWHVIDVSVTDDAREAVEFGLMEAGALGTETIESTNGTARVVGYFEVPVQLDALRGKVDEALRIYGIAPTTLGELTARELPEQDWLTEWKKHWQPVEVGRFVVAPPWSEPPAVAGGLSDRILIRIDPGMAFGTGTHETTRLCLKAIDKYFSGGSILDVGTGTGILAIAAAKLAPGAHVMACDTDGDAIRIARENAALNGVKERIDFSVGSVSEETPSADFVCANLTAPVIIDLLPALLGATCGRLVLSGILDSQFEMVNRRLMQLTASVNEVVQDGEWIALVI